MITVSPAVVAQYAPSSMPIATVKVAVYIDTNNGIVSLQVRLFTAAGVPIPTDRTSIPVFSASDKATLLAYVAGSTDTLQIAVQKAALPYLKSAYGLTGTVS